MEVRMTRELALRLGALPPDRIVKAATDGGAGGPWLLLRDEQGRPLFWPVLGASSCQA